MNRAVKDLIDLMKKSLNEMRDDAIKSIGPVVAEDIKNIYRSKASLIPYEKMIGDQKLTLSRTTNDMAQAVLIEVNDDGTRVYLDTSDKELIGEVRQHELFGEIHPWKDFRGILMPPSKVGKEYLQKILDDTNIEVSLNTK